MRAPSRTVTTGTVAGAVTIIVIWGVGTAFPALDIPPEVGGAFTLILTALSAWIVPDPGRSTARH